MLNTISGARRKQLPRLALSWTSRKPVIDAAWNSSSARGFATTAAPPGRNQAKQSGLSKELAFFRLPAWASGFGLSTAALIAFLFGIACMIGAAAIGFVFSARTVLDWQAVQLWRIEWLLGAVAAFVAGCLLRPAR